MKTDIPINPYWQSFSVLQSSRTKVAAGWLANNVTSATVAESSTHRQCIEAICGSASRPVPVVSVCEELGADRPGTRGNTFAGAVGDQVDRILGNYADVGWWITDQGLHIGAISLKNKVASLNEFDRFVGPLVKERWCDTLPRANTNLPKTSLEEIAKKVDELGLVLKDNLQPKAKKELLAYNQKNNRRPIKSFSAAIQKPLLIRLVRLRFALARTRYLKAEKTGVTSPAKIVPKCFWSHSIS